jgi:hypothetical protein
MATIESKYVDVGFFNGGGKFPNQYGFNDPVSIGTLSDTQNGTSNQDVSGIYSSTDCLQIVWFTTNVISFQVEGVKSNSGWDSITIGSTTLNRSAASFTTNSSGTGSSTWTWSSQSNPFGTTIGADVLVTWDDGQAGIVAPTISSVTNNNASATSVTATVNLSSNGSGGTLKYAQTTSNSVPASGWQTGNTFSHPRGTTRYYWASQDEDTSGAFDDSGAISVGYIAPDTAVSPSSPTISNTATSASITITGVTSGETYQLRNQAGTVQYQSGTASSTSITITQTGGLPSAGSSLTYQVFSLRPTSIGGDGAYDATGDTYTITRQAAVPTYSINAPASINEGSAGTINVTTTNVSNGTTLYWDLDQTTDYSTSQGSVSISSNAGSFTITPTADSTTEGAETDTIRLYSDSGRTTEVANDSFTINDTSTGSGGSSGGGDGTGTYGLKVHGPNGSTIVFSNNLRQVNAVLLATVTLTTQSSTTYTGIAEATDASKVAVIVSKDSPTHLSTGGISITRSTANGGSITLTNASTSTQTIKVGIWRIA